MALVKCRDCGREVSTRAAACPGCGCPVPADAALPRVEDMPPPRPHTALGDVPLTVPPPPPPAAPPPSHRPDIAFSKPSSIPTLGWILGLLVALAGIYLVWNWEGVTRFAREKMDAIFGKVEEKTPERESAPE